MSLSWQKECNIVENGTIYKKKFSRKERKLVQLELGTAGASMLQIVFALVILVIIFKQIDNKKTHL